jgi:hypothetical protein
MDEVFFCQKNLKEKKKGNNIKPLVVGPFIYFSNRMRRTKKIKEKSRHEQPNQ